MSSLDRIVNLFKPYWKYMVLIFVLSFALFYAAGYTVSLNSSITNDGDKLYSLYRMLIHGNFFMAFNTLWSESPMLFTTMISTIALYLGTIAHTVDKYQIKNHPISYFNNAMLILLLYLLIDILLKG